jgi:hypothetical protein
VISKTVRQSRGGSSCPGHVFSSILIYTAHQTTALQDGLTDVHYRQMARMMSNKNSSTEMVVDKTIIWHNS